MSAREPEKLTVEKINQYICQAESYLLANLRNDVDDKVHMDNLCEVESAITEPTSDFPTDRYTPSALASLLQRTKKAIDKLTPTNHGTSIPIEGHDFYPGK